MNVRFAHTGRSHLDELGLFTQFLNGGAACQAHTGAQTAHVLMDNLFDFAFVGNTAFDTFRYQFVGSVVALEVAIGRA